MRTNFEDFVNEKIWNSFQKRKFDLSQYRKLVDPAYQQNDTGEEQVYEEDYVDFEEIRNFLFISPKRDIYLKVDEKTYVPCFSFRIFEYDSIGAMVRHDYVYHKDFYSALFIDRTKFNMASLFEIYRLKPISNYDLSALNISSEIDKKLFFDIIVNRVLNPNN